MSQCLRCSKPCEATSVFCDECRSLLRNEFRQGSTLRSSDSDGAASVVGTRFIASSIASSLAAQESDDTPDDLARHRTMPLGIAETPRSPVAPVTPHPPTLENYTYPDISEQTMSRMSEAAQIISEVEPSNRRLPRASRLAPIRDISADIRRESTPLPRFSKMRYSGGIPEKVNTPGSLPSMSADAPEYEPALYDSNAGLPDLWPWLDSEVEEKENEDTWANATDPLISRHVPNSMDSARIEEEDIKRALAEGVPTNHHLRQVRPRRASSLRIIFAALAVMAALAIIADGVLLSVVVTHPRHATTVPIGPAAAALTLSPNVVNVAKSEQQVQVHIVNFPPGHNVQLSHDLQEDVTTVSGSNMVTIGKNGSANVTIIVNDSWPPAYDQVYAEDISTHYIASAQLQVIGTQSSLPPRLTLDQNVTSLDFGSNIVGSNTIKPLRLLNSGNGSITWSASSNQPWLLPSPAQGMFNKTQSIEVAAQRANLTTGKHTGTLIISSNVGLPIKLTATVVVTPLSPTVGAVLAPTPAVLSFTTTDGSSAPAEQVLTLNNPGTLALNWSLTIPSSFSASNQLAFAHMLGASSNWLSANLTGGTIPSNSSQQIYISVNSNSLLPGAYQEDLLFSAPGSADGSQTVSVSLTVQPHCGLVTNAGFLSFTAVSGKTNPSNQSLGLNTTASCAGASISWKAALSSYGWLNVTPGSGILKGTTGEFISIGANAAGYSPRTYFGFIAFTTQKSTQTVMVQLIVQPPPSPGAPVMSASPLNLNFSNTQGQPNPKGQVVTITNTGGSPLNWSTNVLPLGICWLCASPAGGIIQQNSTGQLVVYVDTSRLTPGTYAGQITLNGADSSGKTASGSGQVVAINLVVQPPCTLTQPSSSSLAFSGVQGGFNPISQSLLITGTGNCAWPLTLSFSASSAPWLSAGFTTGNTIKASGQSVAFVVNADLRTLNSGPPINASFTISAIDSAGTIATGSPQQIAATLTVLPPCLPVAVSNLAFTAAQGQASPAPKTVLLNETGTCSPPINWIATGDPGSSAWLSLSTPTPDSGKGSSFSVAVNSAGLQPNTYTGTITVSATDNNGRAVGAPLTFTVTLTVTPTYTVSGTVLACQPGPSPLCTTSVALPGATLTLFSGSNVVTTITADASGNFSFANLSPGSYTVTITGTDLGLIHYSTSGIPLVVTANVAGWMPDVFPG